MFNWLLGKKITEEKRGENVKKGVVVITDQDGQTHQIDIKGYAFWSWFENFKKFRDHRTVKKVFSNFLKRIKEQGFVRVCDECVIPYTEIKKICLTKIEDHHDEYEVKTRVGGIFGEKR